MFKGSVRNYRIVVNFLLGQVRTLNNNKNLPYIYIHKRKYLNSNKVRKTYLRTKHSPSEKRGRPYTFNVSCYFFFHCAQGHNNLLGTYCWKNPPLDQRFTFSDGSVGLLLGGKYTDVNHTGTKEMEKRGTLSPSCPIRNICSPRGKWGMDYIRLNRMVASQQGDQPPCSPWTIVSQLRLSKQPQNTSCSVIGKGQHRITSW